MVAVSHKRQVGLATGSMGMHPNHTLPNKLQAIHDAGFRYSEIRFSNYVSWVRSQYPDLPESTAPPEWSDPGEPDPADDEIWTVLEEAAPRLLDLAKSLSIEIWMMQPMDGFAGWEIGSERERWNQRKAERWLSLCSALRVKMLQVGSNISAEASGSDEQIARELGWLADPAAAQSPPVQIAYEPLPFSQRISSWEHGWKLVQLADHHNLGLCLDTALMALTPKYGYNPLTGEGYTDDQFESMVTRLRQISPGKIFYVELSDLLKPAPPLRKGSVFDAWDAQNRSSAGEIFAWCVCARPVPLMGRQGGSKDEQGVDGARVGEVLKVLVEMGYDGPIMFESFEALSMEQEDEDVPAVYARRYAESWRLLQDS